MFALNCFLLLSLIKPNLISDVFLQAVDDEDFVTPSDRIHILRCSYAVIKLGMSHIASGTPIAQWSIGGAVFRIYPI